MLRELEPLVAQYARSRATLTKCLDGLTEEQDLELLPERTWSVKDTLIHLATNEALMTELLRDIADGDDASLPEDFDNQKFNEQAVAAGRAKSVAELRAELHASYRKLIALLETMTPEMLTRHGTHPAAGDSDVKQFLLAMYAHHEMHCRDVVEQARRIKKG